MVANIANFHHFDIQLEDFGNYLWLFCSSSVLCLSSFNIINNHKNNHIFKNEEWYKQNWQNIVIAFFFHYIAKSHALLLFIWLFYRQKAHLNIIIGINLITNYFECNCV